MDATATPIAPAQANVEAPCTTPEGRRTRPPDANFTRFKAKTHSVTSFSSKVLNTADNSYKEFWANRFRDNSRIIEDIETFLTEFVPGNDPNFVIPSPTDFFADYRSEDREDCAGLISALEDIMLHFPEERKISFANTRSTIFDSLVNSEHKTKPDVSGTYPGQPIPQSWTWNVCAIAFEVKSKHFPDPIKDSGEFKDALRHNDTLAQIAKNGRNILLASGACFSFSVGVYCDTARIYRFDRARVVISPPFNLRETDILFRFLWRIVHPPDVIHPDGIVLSSPMLLGFDTTITEPSEEDKTWLENKLTTIHHYDEETAKKCVDASKKVLAKYREEPRLTWCYTIGKPLYQSSGLFSRATKVWKVVFEQEPGTVFALKDSWQHVYRCNESQFYEHVRSRSGGDYPNGLAQAIGGVNLGETLESHTTNSFEPYELLMDEGTEGGGAGSKEEPRIALLDDTESDSDSRYEDDDEDEIPDPVAEDGIIDPSITEGALPSTSDGLTNIPIHSDARTALEKESPQAADTAEPREGGSRNASSSRPPQPKKAISIDLNRTHVRIVTYPIGTPVTTFTSTKQLVIAMRDAIEGHEGLAKSGLLHRDISANNILLAQDQKYRGFLHDLDYSAYIQELDEKASEGDPGLNPLSSKMPGTLKEMTGTYQFMARDVLTCDEHKITHDLESFYWLLFWIVLRHVKHEPKMSALERLYDQPNCVEASLEKTGWITTLQNEKRKINIPGNEPLSWLLRQLNHLFFTTADVDHKLVLSRFNRALKRPGWPRNDSALPYVSSRSNQFESSFVSSSMAKHGLEQEMVEARTDERALKKQKTSRDSGIGGRGTGSRAGGSRGRTAGSRGSRDRGGTTSSLGRVRGGSQASGSRQQAVRRSARRQVR